MMYAILMGMWQGMWDDQMSRLWGGAPRRDVPGATERDDPAEGMSEMRSRTAEDATRDAGC
jgi:hypothetical protein